MNLDPHMMRLADLLVEICAREITNAPTVRQTQVSRRNGEPHEFEQKKFRIECPIFRQTGQVSVEEDRSDVWKDI